MMKLPWRARLERALASSIPTSDWLPGRDGRQATRTTRRAAVLVAVEATDSPGIIFTQRSHQLRHHPGQVCFPGGRVEATDASTAEAALRECHEEIGLDQQAVTLLGSLPSHSTVTGFQITPHVGWVVPGQQLQPDQREVAHIFTVALECALDPAHYRRYAWQHEGRAHDVFALDFDGPCIWGATAAMLMGLAQQLAYAEGRDFALPALEKDRYPPFLS